MKTSRPESFRTYPISAVMLLSGMRGADPPAESAGGRRHLGGHRGGCHRRGGRVEYRCDAVGLGAGVGIARAHGNHVRGCQARGHGAAAPDRLRPTPARGYARHRTWRCKSVTSATSRSRPPRRKAAKARPLHGRGHPPRAGPLGNTVYRLPEARRQTVEPFRDVRPVTRAVTLPARQAGNRADTGRNFPPCSKTGAWNP